MCFDVVFVILFVCFCLLGVHWSSWAYGFLVFIKSEKLSVIIFSNIFCLNFIVLSSVDSKFTYWNIEVIPYLTDSLILVLFFWVFFFFCFSFCLVSIPVSSSVVIISFAISNLPIVISVTFPSLRFYLSSQKYDLGFLFISCLYLFNLSSSFLNIWHTVIITVLTSLSADSSICFSSGSTLIGSGFYPHYESYFFASLHAW